MCNFYLFYKVIIAQILLIVTKLSFLVSKYSFAESAHDQHYSNKFAIVFA